MQGFSGVDDTVQLAKSVFAALPLGALAAGAFRVGTAAGDPGDRIVHDTATGRLWYDADGTGPVDAVQFAVFTAGTVLAAADFVIV